MEQKKGAITLKQIAEATGVSIGTLDRIIHNRGRVNADTEARVRRILKKMEYTPNVHAAMLSVRKTFRIAVAIPYFQTGEFWAEIYKGISKAISEFNAIDISLNVLYYNQFDEDSFRQACASCEEWKPDGLLLAPIHRKASEGLVKKLADKGVPTVFVDTRIDAPYLGFFGIDLFQSSYLLSDLIFSIEKPRPKKIAFFHIDRQGNTGNESMIRRREGMQKYIDDNHLDCELLHCNISTSDFLGNVTVLDKFFEQHPDVTVATTSSSRAHIISDWKEIRKVRNLNIYGYDSIPANMKALNEGAIKMLVCEHTNIEAYNAMKCLISHIAVGTVPEKKDNLSPIDILTIHNAKYYL